MLTDFDDMWSGRLGTINATKHHINVDPSAQPIYQQPYRAGPKAREFEKQEIDRMLAEKVIEPSDAEWASPVVFVPKKDGTLRFCVDYRKLNAVTKRDSYPIPRMDECIDSLGEATIFTTLDCNDGYWQVPVADADKDKTTFTSHSGLYRFLRMPFGLKNAPATFQRAVDIILSRVKWQYALVYLDDVIVYSKTIKEHFIHVQTVLQLLRDAGVSLKLAKCSFFDQSVDYLGHVIKPGKLEVASKTVDAIRQARPPTDQTQLRSFLGMCNVYRRFVENFARIAAPLNKKLRKGEPFEFGHLNDAEHSAFLTLKDKLVNPPILALPRHNYHYTLDTDACEDQVGCVLLQEQPNGDKLPIGYWSRSLTQAEKIYSTTERECLAIVWGILALRPYLDSSRFTLRTDHEPLRWILNIAEPSGRLARWRLRLAEFDFEVQYRPGRQHNLADGMSRLLTEGGDTSPIDDEIPCFSVMESTRTTETDPTPLSGMWDVPVDLRFIEDPEVVALADEAEAERETAAEDDGEEREIMPITAEEFLQEQSKDPFCIAKAKMVGDANSHFDVDQYGFLVRRSNLDGALQRVVPKTLRARVLYLSHYPRLAGHPGGLRMYMTLRREYYWPHMANDAFAVARDCRSCRRIRGTRFTYQKYLKLFPAAGPLEFVGMDLLGPFPKSKKGYLYILVITDRFSKMTRAIPMRSTTAASVAQAFLDNWVYPYGVPSYLVTDNGPQFASKFFEAVCTMLGVQHYLTTAYHPQTNGQSERFNRTILDRLRHYVADHQADWDEFVQPLVYAYNMQVHRSTNTTPFDLVLSRHPPNILVKDYPSANPTTIPDDQLTTVQVKRNILRRLRKSLQQANRRLTQAQKRYKDDFDKKVKFALDVQPGQWVFVDRPPRTLLPEEKQNDVTRKLLPRSTGPYEVTKTTGDTVTIKQDGLLNTVSIDRVALAPAPATRETTRTVTADPEGPFAEQQVEEDEEPIAVEFAIDQVVGHEFTPDGMKYKVRWYGWTAKDDTMEPEAHIPYNFVKRYWDKQH